MNIGKQLRYPLFINLRMICRHYGWRLTSYQAGQKAIAALGLSDLTKQTEGFCVKNHGKYYIFYDSNISYAIKRFTVAYAIGNIVLRHLDDRGHIDVQQQVKEAEFFAVVLLTLPLLQQLRNSQV